ncbi:MAG: N-acetylmuramoyl-L-alanine amidase, partial [Chloroflexota bacterium]
FEWHPDHAETEYEVQLGLLGSERTRDRRDEPAFQEIEPFESTGDTIYFPETGHSTSHRFLQVWGERGGVAIFGFPISEKFEERSKTDGKIHLIQYFERNRFEYHPDEPDPYYQVLLGHLGREILIDRGWIPGAPRN